MRPSLDVEIVWGDVTQVSGDVHLVGHYKGVLPQRAEEAFDRAISTLEGAKPSRLLITELTKRGAVRGDLGEILFFPWSRNRTVAIAGMGALGTFQEPELRALARSVATTVGLLPERTTLTSVLIGSGTGNLDVEPCVRGFIEGIVDAVTDDPTLTLDRVRIVEMQLDKAVEILEAAKNARDTHAKRGTAKLRLAPRLKSERGGQIPVDFGFSMLLATLARGSSRPTRTVLRNALTTVLGELPDKPELRARVHARLGEIVSSALRRRRGTAAARLHEIAMAFRLRHPGDSKSAHDIPTRMAFWRDAENICASAITDTTTVAQRTITRRFAHVERAIVRLQNPRPPDVQDLGSELMRVLVPQDFRELLTKDGPLVVEVDRTLSRVQWELLPAGRGGQLLGLHRAISRQLKTQYSVRPFDLVRRMPVRALVIGDPGDPAIGHDLPAARVEALAVTKLLAARNIETTLLLGAPDLITGGGRDATYPPADFFRVVQLLQKGEFDIVHYSGHALFDPASAEGAGWLFTDGNVLTANDLEGMDRPPRLVVANACVSLQLAQVDAERAKAARVRGDASLVAGLADEFFRRGVADYVGTAWEVPSDPAVRFATRFYGELLGQGKRSRALPFGAALQAARNDLCKTYKNDKEHGAAWGAYQHYGDPTRYLDPDAQGRRTRG